MRLFPEWQSNITLPPSPLRRELVGRNAVLQQAFRGLCTSAVAEASQDGRYYIVRTSLAFPFNEILLRLKGSRRIETNNERLVLLAPELRRLQDLGSDTRLKWDDLGLLNRRFSTQKVGMLLEATITYLLR